MVRNVRLWTGLILFVFVTTHLVNHALLLISIDAANQGRDVFLAVWRNPVGTTVLLASLAIHMGLAFWALYARHTLRMHPWEAIQLILGFAIPFQLITHVVGTAFIAQQFGTVDNYFYILWVFWIASPIDGVLQTTTIVVAWVHASIGLHFWMRLKPWYRGWAPVLLSLAVALPLLAMLGVNQGGREILALAQSRSALGDLIASFRLPGGAQYDFALSLIHGFQWAFFGLILLTFVARVVRSWVQRVRGIVRLSYPAGRVVEALPGMTVLEASRLAGVPHASVCGGRGRCSTCRVRVSDGAEHLDPPSAEEQKVLDRVGAPPNVRLACQIRPTRPLHVTPLLPATATPRHAYAQASHLHGEDREIAILFADLRAFTKFSEGKLPYDVVFVLNRYFAAMGQAVTSAGGHLDKFIGDGVMALFGIGKDPARGCREALAGARNMALRLNDLNAALEHDLEEPLRIGVGIHYGPAIIGEMGYGRATTLTAIGDSVNTASRLEAMTKELGVQLVVSHDVETHAGIDLTGYPEETVKIRGRQGVMKVRAIEDAASLPALSEDTVGRPAAKTPPGDAPEEVRA
jgi:adenylate cyclase